MKTSLDSVDSYLLDGATKGAMVFSHWNTLKNNFENFLHKNHLARKAKTCLKAFSGSIDFKHMCFEILFCTVYFVLYILFDKNISFAYPYFRTYVIKVAKVSKFQKLHLINVIIKCKLLFLFR